MQLYKAKVRIGGSPLHEVIKVNLTAAEILVLEQIHGDPETKTVLDIEEIGVLRDKEGKPIARSDAEERDRLRALYLPRTDKKGELRDPVTLALGNAHVPLPKVVAGAKPAEKPKREGRMSAAEVAARRAAPEDPVAEMTG